MNYEEKLLSVEIAISRDEYDKLFSIARSNGWTLQGLLGPALKGIVKEQLKRIDERDTKMNKKTKLKCLGDIETKLPQVIPEDGDFVTDTELLDFLQELTNKARYTGKVECRSSTSGRGWRLYETSGDDAVPDVRQAIINYMKDSDFKLGLPHRFSMYGIGQEDEHNGIGMWDGPNPSEEKMLAVDGRDKNSVIVRFNKDGTDEIIWRWVEGWVEGHWVKNK